MGNNIQSLHLNKKDGKYVTTDSDTAPPDSDSTSGTSYKTAQSEIIASKKDLDSADLHSIAEVMGTNHSTTTASGYLEGKSYIQA